MHSNVKAALQDHEEEIPAEDEHQSVTTFCKADTAELLAFSYTRKAPGSPTSAKRRTRPTTLAPFSSEITLWLQRTLKREYGLLVRHILGYSGVVWDPNAAGEQKRKNGPSRVRPSCV